jgi:hypothetical protein
MKGKRTGVEFEEHELKVISQEGALIYHLKKPDSIMDNIKFINTNNMLIVTGDYGNWMFDREFHPSADGYVSDYYWVEKLKRSSCQEPEEFDVEETEAEIKKLLEEEEDLDEAEKDYLEGCLNNVTDSEFDYTRYAHRENVGRFQDHEDVPHCKKIKIQLQIVFDGFDEMCRRMKEEENKKS